MQSTINTDTTSKEATLQVVYDVLKLTPFYKAFQASTDVPEIYMHERSTSKKKASVHKKKSDSDTTPKEKPPTDPKDKRVKQTIPREANSNTQPQESGSGEEVDHPVKVPNEQVHEKTGTDEEASDKLECDGVDDANQDLDAHDDDDDDATESDDDDEVQEEDDDEDEEDISDQLVHISLDYQASDESEKQKDDDKVKDDEEDKEGD
ncbi:hypothetical protein Tco_1530568 [Tanacetum coccineum]